MNSLVVGIVLIVGGLAFAVYPLLKRKEGEEPQAPRPSRASARGGGGASRAREARPTVADALATEREELDLDRAMGKLSDADHARLVAALEARARRLLAQESSTPSPPVPAATPDAEAPPRQSAAPAPVSPASSATADDEAERLIRDARGAVVTCGTCGPRPEPGARFCSSCGSALGGCPSCGAEIRQVNARFCDQCGSAVRG